MLLVGREGRECGMWYTLAAELLVLVGHAG